MIDAEEHVAKIEAAVEARGDRAFFITARTDALETHGVDEAIRRAPIEQYPWDGVAEVRPFGALTKKIVEGVY